MADNDTAKSATIPEQASTEPPTTSQEDEELTARCLELKTKGNEAFMKMDFGAAVDAYTEAIELKPNAVLLSNRAFCYIKTEAFGLARADAIEAIRLDPKYAKGYYRLGSAHVALGQFKKALSDFKQLVKLAPRDRSARMKLEQCRKEVKRIAFEEAIAVEKPPPMSETLNANQILVPDSYDGPRLGEDGKVTKEFVMELVEWLRKENRLHRKYVVMILIQVVHMFMKMPSLIDVSIPEKNSIGEKGILTVCGDTHGQFYDVLNIFKINGYPSEENPYLFNGDFVDRGSFSVELIIVLLAFKVLYPDHLHLMRGNHETKYMNKIYGFEGEVKHKYDGQIMDLFTEVFSWLPLASCLNQKVLVMHGGLFQKDGVKLDDIRKIDRNREAPDEGLMSDLLWSDPQPFPGRGPSKRGVGQSFGPDITKRFLDDNGLSLIVRSHEVREEGYLEEHDGKLITVFSAPNYCDQVGNKGAFIRFDHECNKEFVQFQEVPHPDIKPMAYATGMNMWGM